MRVAREEQERDAVGVRLRLLGGGSARDARCPENCSRQRPNQRARRVAPNCCFSRAYSRDGS